MKRSPLHLVATILSLGCTSAAFANPIVPGYNSSTLAANDDGSSGLTTLPFLANFFGVTYSSLYVNNNGNVTFSGQLSSYTPYGLSGSNQSIIAPFFADVDTRGAGSGVVTYGDGIYNGHQTFGVEYPNVGYYSEHTDKLDNFQLLLVDRSDVAVGDFDIYFNYGQMQWETGDASSGSDGLGGSCAVAGYSNGTIAGSSQVTYQLPGSATCGALIDGGPNALSTNTNDGVTGQYLFQARAGAVVTPPPMAVTPEPGTLALVGTGMLGLVATMRRRILRQA